MKAKPLRWDKEKKLYFSCEPKQATHVELLVPGPLPNRIIPVVLGNATRAGTNCWSWNGDAEEPTLKPSIKTTGTRSLTDDDIKKIDAGIDLNLPDIVCHSFVNDGKIKFLADSTHEFAGQTMDLLEVSHSVWSVEY